MNLKVTYHVILNNGTLLRAFCTGLNSSIEKMEWELKEGECYFKGDYSDLYIEQEALKQVLPRLSPEKDLELAFCMALSSRLEEPLSNP